MGPIEPWKIPTAFAEPLIHYDVERYIFLDEGIRGRMNGKIPLQLGTFFEQCSQKSKPKFA